MEADIKKLIQQLASIQDKAQEVENLLNDVRIKINDMLWDLMEMKTSKRMAQKATWLLTPFRSYCI